jgi:hypothetical protein
MLPKLVDLVLHSQRAFSRYSRKSGCCNLVVVLEQFPHFLVRVIELLEQSLSRPLLETELDSLGLKLKVDIAHQLILGYV